MKFDIHFLSYLAQFFSELENFHTNVVEKIKTHFMFNNYFFFENCAVHEIMWKNIVQPGKAKDDNTAHAHCMLYT
jgi:hypothetical protein